MKTATYIGVDGKEFTVEYDENALCVVCSLPVVEASVGGTAICGWCDAGYNRDGSKWTWQQSRAYMRTGKIPLKESRCNSED